MEIDTASAALGALANPARLAIYRLLVRAGPEGMAAGDIAAATATPPSSLSANLTILSHAGLAKSTRAGRSIRYAVDFERMAGLLAFLVQDCCGGAPEVCAPLAAVTAHAACCA